MCLDGLVLKAGKTGAQNISPPERLLTLHPFTTLPNRDNALHMRLSPDINRRCPDAGQGTRRARSPRLPGALSGFKDSAVAAHPMHLAPDRHHTGMSDLQRTSALSPTSRTVLSAPAVVRTENLMRHKNRLLMLFLAMFSNVLKWSSYSANKGILGKVRNIFATYRKVRNMFVTLAIGVKFVCSLSFQ